LWAYLDKFHKVAWRGGKQFPAGTSESIQLLDDGQLDLAITFNPNSVYSAQSSGRLAETTKAYALESGALSNIHFLAIPWNANASAGAQVTINFLLSPEAQSRKGDLNVWGDPSVLSSKYLTGSAKNTQQFKSIDEPHPSWQNALEKEWLKRYGN
ncbi:extracellular solute-binding protein, partial [Vibrio sp. 10N.222.51.A6]